MIDFRYHLVSLISVFLALAVGVVLGAGPLQNSLGTALNDQVTSLRENRKAMQTQLEQTEAAVNDRDDYIAAAAAAYLPGTLEGKKVALAVLPEAKSDDIDTIIAQLEAAGGTINGRVSLTTAWTDPSREAFRESYSGQLAGHLGKTVSTDGNGVLGEGLGTALTGDAQTAKQLMDLLTATDTPLVSVDTRLNGPADMIVVIGPRSPDATAPRDSETTDAGGLLLGRGPDRDGRGVHDGRRRRRRRRDRRGLRPAHRQGRRHHDRLRRPGRGRGLHPAGPGLDGLGHEEALRLRQGRGRGHAAPAEVRARRAGRRAGTGSSR